MAAPRIHPLLRRREAFGSPAQAEVCWRLTRELEATGVFDNITAYRELLAGFTARFHDLHGHDRDAALGADPAIAWPAGQAVERK